MHHILQCSFLGAISLWLTSAFPLSPCLGRIFPQLGSTQLPLLSIGSVIAQALRCGWGTLVLHLEPYQWSNSCQFDLVVLVSLVLHPGCVSYSPFFVVWLISLVPWSCGPSYGVMRSFVVLFSFASLITTYLCFHISFIIPLLISYGLVSAECWRHLSVLGALSCFICFYFGYLFLV